jgi:hypothetical protein
MSTPKWTQLLLLSICHLPTALVLSNTRLHASDEPSPATEQKPRSLAHFKIAMAGKLRSSSIPSNLGLETETEMYMPPINPMEAKRCKATMCHTCVIRARVEEWTQYKNTLPTRKHLLMLSCLRLGERPQRIWHIIHSPHAHRLHHMHATQGFVYAHAAACHGGLLAPHAGPLTVALTTVFRKVFGGSQRCLPPVNCPLFEACSHPALN